MMSSGVISDPPPMPVRPTSRPTPRPKRTTRGSIARRRLCRVQTALELAGPRPASLAAVARLRARDAADRRVALVVQLVVREVVRVDVPPDVLLRPRGQRRDLPQ